MFKDKLILHVTSMGAGALYAVDGASGELRFEANIADAKQPQLNRVVAVCIAQELYMQDNIEVARGKFDASVFYFANVSLQSLDSIVWSDAVIDADGVTVHQAWSDAQLLKQLLQSVGYSGKAKVYPQSLVIADAAVELDLHGCTWGGKGAFHVKESAGRKSIWYGMTALMASFVLGMLLTGYLMIWADRPVFSEYHATAVKTTQTSAPFAWLQRLQHGLPAGSVKSFEIAPLKQELLIKLNKPMDTQAEAFMQAAKNLSQKEQVKLNIMNNTTLSLSVQGGW